MGFVPDKQFRREATTETEVGAPQKRSDIVRFLSEKLNLPVRTGRFRGGNKGVMGIFKIKPEVVRSKFANDIETISHEIGHALEKYLWPETRDAKGNLTGTAFKDFANELNAIASQPRKGQPIEPVKRASSLLHGLTEGRNLSLRALSRESRVSHPHILPGQQTAAGHLRRISSWTTMPVHAAEQP
ncbi:MAG: hypothetical protein HY026_06630 [Deltaproteobacteria bacterium]|nr:hypothetical protein [Deltaproteobacteria bacterium]